MSVEKKSRLLLDAVFAVMTADDEISDVERAAILVVLKKLGSPMTVDQVNAAFFGYQQRVAAQSKEAVLTATIESVAQTADTLDDRAALMEALRVVADSDGVTEDVEKEIIDRFWDALASDQQKPQKHEKCEDCGHSFRVWATQGNQDVCPKCGKERHTPSFLGRLANWWSS